MPTSTSSFISATTSTNTAAASSATCAPTSRPVETITLSDYRTRHAQYKRDVDLQEVHRQHPMIAIWDDHEVANNSHADGAQNHSEGSRGHLDRRASPLRLQAYYEWMPVRVVDAGNLRKNNRAFAYGDLVDLLMLEERLVARSPQLLSNTNSAGIFTQSGAYADPSRQLLGTEEEDWLATRLRSSTAKWKFIGQGVMFAQAEGAAGVQRRRWRTLRQRRPVGRLPAGARPLVRRCSRAMPRRPPVGNVVVLSGDFHSSWAADLTQDPNNSDIAAGGYDPAPAPARARSSSSAHRSRRRRFVDTNGLAESALRFINPHFKYIELTRRGYLLLDADADARGQRMVVRRHRRKPKHRAVVRRRVSGPRWRQSTDRRGADEPACQCS